MQIWFNRLIKKDGCFLPSILIIIRHKVNYDKAKKLYQFRLVGIDTVRKVNLEKLNSTDSLTMAEYLHKNINYDLNDCKQKLTNANISLQVEFKSLKDNILASFLLTDNDKK